MKDTFLLFILLSFAICAAGEQAAAGTVRRLQCIELTGYPLCGASSRLEEDDDWWKYSEINLFDGDPRTAWVAGAEGDGTGEEIWFEVEPGLCELHFIGGWSTDAFSRANHNRVKSLKAHLWAGVLEAGRVSELGPLFTVRPALPPWTIELADTPHRQIIDVDLDWETAGRIMEEAIEDADAFDRCVYILTLTVDEIYSGTSAGNTGIAEISWNLLPEYTGPGGIGRIDLTGTWINIEGSSWERIEFEWYPFYQGWAAYVDGALYDSGTWAVGNGKLNMYSDSGMNQYFFHGWTLDDTRLVLIEEEGEPEIWMKQGAAGRPPLFQ